MEDKQEIAFGCPYCHRVHCVDGDARGRVIECLCGKRVEVPDAASNPETPPHLLPLGREVGPVGDEGRGEPAGRPSGKEGAPESTPELSESPRDADAAVPSVAGESGAPLSTGESPPPAPEEPPEGPADLAEWRGPPASGEGSGGERGEGPGRAEEPASEDEPVEGPAEAIGPDVGEGPAARPAAALRQPELPAGEAPAEGVPGKEEGAEPPASPKGPGSPPEVTAEPPAGSAGAGTVEPGDTATAEPARGVAGGSPSPAPPSHLALQGSAREHGVTPERAAEIEALIWDAAPATLSPQAGRRSRRKESRELDLPAISRRGAASGPSSSRSGTYAKGSSSMGKGYFIAAVVLLVVWLIHTSPWIYLEAGPAFLQQPLPEAVGIVEHTHYFYLERAFWSALLAGLVIALAGEGYTRWSRARGGY